MVEGQSKPYLIKRKFWIIVHGRKRYQRFTSFGVKCLFLPWGWEMKLLWLYSHVVHTLFSGLLISSQILPFNCNFNERSGYVTRSLRRWHEPRFLPIGLLFVLRFCFVLFFFIFSNLWISVTVIDSADPLSSSHQCYPAYAWRLTLAIELPFQVTYSPLKNCSSPWDSSNFVAFLRTLTFAPPLSLSIVFLASCSFSSIAAICLAKSNWFLCQLCCTWHSFSLRSEFSLSFSKRASLRKVISFSLAVKIREINVHFINT